MYGMINTTKNHSTEFRPQFLGDVLGQEEVKDAFRIKKAGFQKTGKLPGHVLLLGAPGVGKTTLAKVLANELGVEFREIMGHRIERFSDILDVLNNIGEGKQCIIFIDEIHALSKQIQEELYPIMEDFAYDYYDTYFEVHRRVKLPRFTLIGATTHAGNLNAPLLSRFQDIYELAPYNIEQLTSMVKNAGRRVYGVEVPNDVADNIARLSRSTARHAYNLLHSLMETAEAFVAGQVQGNHLTKELLTKTLRLKRIDPIIGLDASQRKYLVTMLRERVPIGAKSLAAMINEQESTISYKVEPFLLSDIILLVSGEEKYGALARITKRGRIATELAQDYVRMCQSLQRNDGWFVNESLSF